MITKQFSYKTICYFLEDKGSDEGFTLLELIVVILFLGILVILAVPNLLDQVGKARETELKNAAGTVNRAQHAYHSERQTFATAISFLGVSLPIQFITNSNDLITGVSPAAADVQPANSNAVYDNTRAYSGRIVHADGKYEQILCKSNAAATQLPAPSGTLGALACPSGISIEIE